MTAALEGGEWSAARPGRTLPPGKTRYPPCRRLGGPQGRCGRAENLVPTGIRSRTVQPVVNRYTDWATGPTQILVLCLKHISNGHLKFDELKLNGKHQQLDITEDYKLRWQDIIIRIKTKSLLVPSKEIGLGRNIDKIKYMTYRRCSCCYGDYYSSYGRL